MTSFNLASHFNQYFEAILANSEQSRREIYRLRYAVYCEELRYENPDDFPNGEERDGFDEHAIHALIRHRETGRTAGCVRLLTNHQAPGLIFPFESVCGTSLRRDVLDPSTLDRRQLGEISRLAVHQHFRRRTADTSTASGQETADTYIGSERHYPLISMGLFLVASALAISNAIAHTVVMMEPRLARLLGSCGIRFTALGEIIEYHGRRGPFVITPDQLRAHINPGAEELLNELLLRLK